MIYLHRYLDMKIDLRRRFQIARNISHSRVKVEPLRDETAAFGYQINPVEMMSFILFPKLNSSVGIIGSSALLALLLTAIYRLYMTPAAKFPGPRLAALSFWYEFYYDVWPYQGQYTWKIRELHRRYGMFYVQRILFSGQNTVPVLGWLLTCAPYLRFVCSH